MFNQATSSRPLSPTLVSTKQLETVVTMKMNNNRDHFSENNEEDYWDMDEPEERPLKYQLKV